MTILRKKITLILLLTLFSLALVFASISFHFNYLIQAILWLLVFISASLAAGMISIMTGGMIAAAPISRRATIKAKIAKIETSYLRGKILSFHHIAHTGGNFDCFIKLETMIRGASKVMTVIIPAGPPMTHLQAKIRNGASITFVGSFTPRPAGEKIKKERRVFRALSCLEPANDLFS